MSTILPTVAVVIATFIVMWKTESTFVFSLEDLQNRSACPADDTTRRSDLDADQKRDDETAIRELIEGWAAAVRRRDVAGALHNHSADILMFDVPPPLKSEGIEAYRQTWDPFFSWSQEPVRFDIVEMRVTAGADVAFAAALMQCAGREVSGENIELDFRLTVGLQKIDGQWVVTHEHHSIPAEK